MRRHHGMAMKNPQTFLFSLSPPFSDEDVAATRAVAQSLAIGRDWYWARPEYIDVSDDSSCTRPEDTPIRTVGVVLRLPPPSSADIERLALSEFEAALTALGRLTVERAPALDLELDGEWIGEIRGGVPDEGLVEGLLKPWLSAANSGR